MLYWYTFSLDIADNAGFTEAQSMFTGILVSSGGMSGVALFYKHDYPAGKNVFYAAFPESMAAMSEVVSRMFPLTPCERPTGLELTVLVSGSNDQDDYNGISRNYDNWQV